MTADPQGEALQSWRLAPLDGGIHLVLDAEGCAQVLLETAEARVFLGCLCDAGGGRQRVLEIWVQRIDAPTPDGIEWLQSARSNAELDAGWERMLNWRETLEKHRLWRTGKEHHPWPPLWLENGKRLTLPEMRVVQDDAPLAAAGLPSYAGTRSRFLAVETPEGTAWRRLDWTGEDSTGGLPVRQWEAPAGAPAFNPCGARLMVRTAAPWTLSEFVRFISTGVIEGAVREWRQPALKKGEAARDLKHAPNLYLQGWAGGRAPLAEILHIKMNLAMGILERLESGLRSVRRPFLNLETASFDADWSGWDAGLAAWSGAPQISTPGAALVWQPSSTSDDPVFLLPEAENGRSIYRHPSVAPPRNARGKVRLREITRDKHSRSGELIAEGTLLVTGKPPERTDWILIRCPWSAAPLQAAVRDEDEKTPGGVIFRTTPWMPAAEFSRIGEGGAPPRELECDCVFVPRLNAPADLYSAGIIILEMLCSGAGAQSLPRVVDECLRLAARLDEAGVRREEVPDTLAVWRRKEAREPWTKCLSPANLAAPLAPEESAWTSVPAECWFAVLGWSLRLLTSQWSAAYFPAPGEGSVLAPHSALLHPMADLRVLLARTRALVTLDWSAHREIRAQIRAFLKG